MRGFLLDTNIFNHLAEGRIQKEDLPLDYPVFVTPLQRDEIMQCPDTQKRSNLLAWLQALPDHQVPLETLVFGIGHWGQAKFSDGKLYEILLSALKIKKKRKNHANEHDALIGEVAIKNEMVLITNDNALATVVKAKGGQVRIIPYGTE